MFKLVLIVCGHFCSTAFVCRSSLPYTVVASLDISILRLEYSPSRRLFIFIKEVRVQHWCRVRLLESKFEPNHRETGRCSRRGRHETRSRHLCRFRDSSIVSVVLRDRLRVSRRALSSGRRLLRCYCDCCLCCGRIRYRRVRRDCALDFRCRRRYRRASTRSVPVLSFSSVFPELMSGQPSESTDATNTRRRAADRRARAGSSSSVESDRPDATVMRRGESDSASYVRLHHRDSDPLRRADSFHTADGTLLVPQLLNPAPLDSVLSALLIQMKQLSSELASRDAAQSAAITAVSDRLNRLERSRSDRSDRESANLQSVPMPPPARHSRRRISRVETR